MLKLYVHLQEAGVTKDVLIYSNLSPDHLVGQLEFTIEKSLEQDNQYNEFQIQGVKVHPRTEKVLGQYRVLGSYFNSGDDVYCELKMKEMQETKEIDGEQKNEKIESEETKAIVEQEKKQEKVSVEPTAESTMPKINSKALNNYSFFESSKKFVKVLVDLPGIGAHPQDKIETSFKRKSFYIQILDFKGQNYHFGCGWLQHKVQPEHCSYRLKQDRMEIKLRKRVDSQNWFSLFKQRVVGANGGYETSGDEEGEKED